MVKESVDPKTKKLFRSETDRILGGVAAGYADFFEIDSTLVRLIFILLFLFGGSGLLIYLVSWLLIPSESRAKDDFNTNIDRNIEEIKNNVKGIGRDWQKIPRRNGSRRFLGFIFLVLGFMFFLKNFGILSLIEFRYIWPILFVILGFRLLL